MFRSAAAADNAMWARARGWALWKAMKTLAENLDTNPATAAEARRVIKAVSAE